MTDSHSLVTIARFYDVVQAELARNDLGEAGIRAFLLDQGIVSTVWYLTTAVGGIRLQVAAKDAERALTILSQREQETIPAREEGSVAVEVPDGEEEGDFPDADDEDDAQPQPTKREEDAERAFRGAVLGLLLLPLQLYVFWILLGVLTSEERLAPRYRLRALLAAAISIPLFLLIMWVVVNLRPASWPSVTPPRPF